MSSLGKIWFILNPISGGKSNEFLKEIIATFAQINKWDYTIKTTQFAGHAIQLAKEAVQQNISIVCAIGGDGTINEIGSELVKTKTALAIIPRGSGNGLSRHIGIPTKPIKALEIIKQNHTTTIDVGLCNGKYFFCSTGFALDALIAKKFDEAPTRGLLTYLKSGFQEFLRYKPRAFTVIKNGETIETKPLLLSITNANQYGNNTFIAPHASLTDEKLDLCFLSVIPAISWVNCCYSLATKKINAFKYYSTETVEKLEVFSNESFYHHIDGEIKEKITTAEINIEKKALKVITPPFFEG